MRLNLDYYKEENLCQVNPKEEKVIEYINSKNPEDYQEIVKKDLEDEVVLGLSDIRKNLIYSYDFKENASVLEIGGHLGEVTGSLCEKNEKVVTIEFCKKRAEAIAKRHENCNNLEIIVGNLQDIKIEEKFDYITLIGVLEYAQQIFDTEYPVLDLLKYCMNLLNPDGKLLIATNNKFALKSYIGDIDECTGITFDSITGYKSSRKQYKFGKKQIEEFLKQAEFNYYKFYYPLPDYKLPSLIFSDSYLPSSSKINGYFPYYASNSFVFYSEVDAYDAIIKENKEMFPFFANSYFIEASKQEFKNDVRFVSFNNYRKEEYQLMTKIRETIVEKTYINKKAKKHLENMADNIHSLNEDKIEILDQVRGEKITSQFIKSKLASQIISDNVKKPDEVLKILEKYKNTIEKLSVEYNPEEKTVFEKYEIEVDNNTLNKFRYLKNGYWDMILKNCFIIDDRLVFFDQEWMEKNVPMEFLIYRSIVNIEKLRSRIDEYQLYEKMGIKEYISIFEELDRKITEKIIDEEFFNFYIRKHKNPIYDNYQLQEENKRLIQNNEKLVKEIEELQQNSNSKEEEIKTLKNQINNIYDSKSWKFARKLSKIKRAFK